MSRISDFESSHSTLSPSENLRVCKFFDDLRQFAIPRSRNRAGNASKGGPVIVHVALKDGRYIGQTVVKQTDFEITPPGKAGVTAKDEVRIQFDVRLAS